MIRRFILSAGLVALAPPVFAQAASAVIGANKAALREPVKSGFLNAVQVYPYSEGALFRLFAAPERVSDIALQPGETLTSVAAGDTVRWTVGDTTSGSGGGHRTHILVKPFTPGLSTNLVITTDRRVYHVLLTSTASTAMTSIRWTYPLDEMEALARHREEADTAKTVSTGIAIDQLQFNYRISGDTPVWRPIRAFDDGRQTWIEFPADLGTGEAPPLFVLGSEGVAELVNYRIVGRYYVVDRLFAAAELRLGAKKQKIVRITRVGKKSAGRGRGA